MADEQHDDQFINQLTGCQDSLYAYVLTLIPNPESARDILQETNVVLWRRRGDFEPGTSYNTWACKVAFFQALAFRRDKGRDRHIFSEDVMTQLADEAAADLENLSERRTALKQCLDQLPERQRWLIAQRYSADNPTKTIAQITARLIPGV